MSTAQVCGLEPGPGGAGALTPTPPSRSVSLPIRMPPCAEAHGPSPAVRSCPR